MPQLIHLNTLIARGDTTARKVIECCGANKQPTTLPDLPSTDRCVDGAAWPRCAVLLCTGAIIYTDSLLCPVSVHLFFFLQSHSSKTGNNKWVLRKYPFLLKSFPCDRPCSFPVHWAIGWAATSHWFLRASSSILSCGSGLMAPNGVLPRQ